LAKCLRSIKNQTYKNIETIVVDRFSKDKTVEIAKSYGAKVFVTNARERSVQKNFGVKQSIGKYAYIVDSDFIVEPEVIEEAVKKCENENYDAICIHNTSDPTISFWSKVKKLERDCYKDDELNVAARFFRKEVFGAIGGFNESLVAGEDYDLHNRLLEKGFRIGRIKAQEIHIGEPKTIWEIARKHYYYGKTIGEFIKKNPRRGMKQLSPIRPAFIRHWKKFVRHPILSLGFIIYQFVRYFSAGLGFLESVTRGRKEMHTPFYSQGIVTLTFDDCYEETINNVISILSKYKMKATFYFPTSFIGKKFEGRKLVSENGIKKLVKKGHEIASHSHSHIPVSITLLDNIHRFMISFLGSESENKLNFLRRSIKFFFKKNQMKNVEQYINDILKSKTTIEKRYRVNCVSFAFPDGVYNNKVLNILQRLGFTSARTSDIGYNHFKKLKPYALKVQSWDKCTTPEMAEKWVKKAYRKKLWLIEVFHLVGRENNDNYEYFTSIYHFKKHIEFLNKMKTRGLWILPQKEVMEIFSEISGKKEVVVSPASKLVRK